MNGWVKLHRKIVDWEWYDDNKTFKLFIHLLLTANHEDKQWHGILIKRGQKLTGRKKLAKETKLSERKIRTALNSLKMTNEIAIKTTSKYSIITVLKWDEYQIQEEKRPAKRPAFRPSNDHQTTTNKNDKNDKEIKNIYNQKTFKDGDKITLYDGTIAIMRFGVWCDSVSPFHRLDRSYYKELP